MKPPKNIEVLSLDVSASGGVLLALASVRVGQLTFHHVRLLKDPVGGFAVAGPQIVRQTAQGPRHQTLVAWPKLWRVAILQKLLERYQGNTSRQEATL